MTTATQPRLGGYEIGEGDRMLIARARQGLTQKQLAKKVGISYQTVGSMERGGPVKPIHRKRMAAELGVDEGWLETGQLGEGDDGGIPAPIPHRRSIKTGYRNRRIHRDRITPDWGVHLRPTG